MANFKRVILKDPVTGDLLAPKVPGTLMYEDVEGKEVAPFEFETKANIPSGLIAMWSGTSNAIPSGWLLCNGSNGTPDLRDRFIVGAGNEYTVGATGGEKTHTLTTEEMPSHTHDGGVTGTRGAEVTVQSGTVLGYSGSTSSVGGDKAHENRPPYYALCFIMKA